MIGNSFQHINKEAIPMIYKYCYSLENYYSDRQEGCIKAINARYWTFFFILHTKKYTAKFQITLLYGQKTVVSKLTLYRNSVGVYIKQNWWIQWTPLPPPPSHTNFKYVNITKTYSEQPHVGVLWSNISKRQWQNSFKHGMKFVFWKKKWSVDILIGTAPYNCIW